MIQDMKTILTRMFTVVVLMMISMAAWGQGEYVTVDIGKFDNGTITESQPQKQDGDQVIVTLNVEPQEGFSVLLSEIYIYETISPNMTRAGESPELGKRLYLDPPKGFEDKKITKATECTVTVDANGNFGVWVKSADFQKKRDDSKGPTDGDGSHLGNDYSGMSYIANYNDNNYNPEDRTNNYYLCPSAVYYDFDGSPANQKPYLTTHKPDDSELGTNDKPFSEQIAKWNIKFKETIDNIDYYYIKYVDPNGSEKYLVHNKIVISGKEARIR